MNKTAPPLGGSAAGAGEERSKLFNNLPAQSAQQPPKPHVRRAVAPPLPCCGSNTLTTILELVALHLRRTIPVLSGLTLNDFDEALDHEIREALFDEGD
jgi:hypothetical protein